MWAWLQANPITGVIAFLGAIFMVTRLIKQIVEMYFDHQKRASEAGMAMIERLRVPTEPEPDHDEEEEEEKEEDDEPKVKGPSVWDLIRGKK